MTAEEFRKLNAKTLKTAKYRNSKTTVNGITFDSKKEAERYLLLLSLQNLNGITDLKLQPEFTLQEACKTPQGESIRAIRYRADFSYMRGGRLVVEDVKSEHTRKLAEYRMKYKLVLEKYGIKIEEV